MLWSRPANPGPSQDQDQTIRVLMIITWLDIYFMPELKRKDNFM